jgi:hypothetical protein
MATKKTPKKVTSKKPTKTTKAAKASKPVKSTKSAKTTKPVKSTKLAKTTKPAISSNAPMSKVGPIQVMVFGFDRTDQFRGEVLEQLINLRGRGLIRLIDLFVAMKNPSGELLAMETNDLTEKESVEFGKVIGKLLGKQKVTAGEAAAVVVERTLAAAAKTVGLDYRGIAQAVKNLKPGKAFGVLMVEHVWAIPLRDAIREAGGFPLAQGFLTPEALVMVGEELEAIAEAERTIEVAQVVQAIAILDTLATLEEADAIKTAIAADVVRTLAIANVIEEAAVAEAIEALAAAELMEKKYLEAAAKTEAQEAAEDKEVFSAVE